MTQRPYPPISMGLSVAAVLRAHQQAQQHTTQRLYLFVPIDQATLARAVVQATGLHLPVIGLTDTGLTVDGWAIQPSLTALDHAILTGHANAI